jgi:hypothetical protein
MGLHILRRLRWVVLFVLVLAVAGPAQATAPGWGLGGLLGTGRDWHTATLLNDGSVLVSGGYIAGNGTVTNSAERYFPATNTWQPAGTLVVARSSHVAALLDNGKVLVAGGVDSAGKSLKSAELYDPAANSWSAVGEMAVLRKDATATKLPNGKVLITGGYASDTNTVTATTDIFDPANNSFSPGKPMGTPRSLHAATRLANGNVLVTGGYTNTTGTITPATEIYDATTGNWSAKAPMGTKRAIQEATLLADGRVLVSGGGDGIVHLGTAEVYSPAFNTWTSTAVMPRAANYHTATLLNNGKVLVAGGVNAAGAPDESSLLYDPATNAWSAAGNTSVTHVSATATLLPSGRVLIAAGNSGGGAVPGGTVYQRSSELWTPTTTLLADPAVSFDDLPPGAASGAVAHISNTGDSPLLASGFALGGSFPGDYAITSDGCSAVAVAPGSSCAIGLQFAPKAAGARGATLTFEANTAALTQAVSLIGRGIAPAVQPAPIVPQATPRQTIVVTLAYTFSAASKSTKLSGLMVKGVPSGSTITVSCKKGCARKSLVKRNAHGTVRLTGLVTKRLKVGTVITVTVSRPGAISAVKTLTIRKSKAPQVTTRCQAPGKTKPTAC